jgi:hypothetical protein
MKLEKLMMDLELVATIMTMLRKDTNVFFTEREEFKNWRSKLIRASNLSNISLNNTNSTFKVSL